MSQHSIQRRYRAEELVRARRSDEARRYAASQRQGRIDPNPHQIDAVVFALQRLREGGCILADEVGLGKTIEAGLVIAQLQAESAKRVLVILPKALMGQWQSELYSLFGITANEVNNQTADFTGNGVFLVGREFAGGESGSELIAKSDLFDLCVIDEAHEIFAGIYKRIGKDGLPKSDSRDAMTAHRVRSFLGPTPVLLLTATPIQNSLAELWGLVQYVEPTQTLLGALPTFRDLFCEPGSKDRRLIAGQAGELRKRINVVCQRTLRRQAQEFLERPFTTRRAMLFEYQMTAEERSLYDGVTEYLLEPELCAFSGKSRQLLLIGFHRRMASSFPALISSLEKVASRLQRMLNDQTDETAMELLADLELDADDVRIEATESHEEAQLSPERIAAELAQVQAFIEHGNALVGDAKAEELVSAVRQVFEQEAIGEGSGKVVIFTESCTTQDYLRKVLVESDLGLTDAQVTLFRGQNSSSRTKQALATWQDEVGTNLSAERLPSTSVATRLALVHEFKTRSRVFISTEAGAKGLNLQFCDTIVNFDLPWNPQRIEQRIGRCHRYSQLRDVTVINFIASDNEAQRLTFEILSEKLDLFGEVLDASDVVLHEPQTDAPEVLATAFGSDIETRLQQIYDLARSQEDLSRGLKELSSELESRRKDFEATQERMERVIESRFDDSVKAVFRRIAAEVPETLAELDRDTEQVLVDWLDSQDIAYAANVDEQDRHCFDIEPSAALPQAYRDGARVAVGSGRGLKDREQLFIGHPLLRTAVESARSGFPIENPVSIQSPELADRIGQRGRLILLRTRTDGFECVEQLLPLGILESTTPDDPELLDSSISLDMIASADIADCSSDDFGGALNVDAEAVEDLVEETLFLTQQKVSHAEQVRFESFIEQLERYADDQAMLVRRELSELREQLEKAQANWEAATGADARTRAERSRVRIERETEERESRLAMLENRTDEHYQRCRERAYERRYAEPVVERIFDVEFMIR